MPLEAGTLIPELNANNPLGSDPKSEGDDHLRLIKRTVLGSFPAFVGTTATPKTVTLSEDEINDAALQARANTFSALNTFNSAPRLANAIPLNARNVAGTAEIPLIQLDSSDRTIVGDATSQQINQSATQNQYLVDGVTVAFFLALNSGGIQVRDRRAAGQKVGFRNGPFGGLVTTISDDYTVVQDDEGTVLHLGTGVQTATLSLGTMEATSVYTIVNRGTAWTLAPTGITLEWEQGGTSLQGNRTLAPNSVVQVWFINSVFAIVYGNGLT